MNYPWFRMYAEAVDDEKLRLLASSDRWYYVGILCCKAQGLLDKEGDTKDLRIRKLAIKLDLTQPELVELKRRLIEVNLIDSDWQPLAWAKRQRHSKDLPEGESLGDYKGYVYFIGGNVGPLKIGYSKNPWSRVKDFQTGSAEQLSVVTTIRTTEHSEIDVHKLFASERMQGEWFERSDVLAEVINRIRAKKITSIEGLSVVVEQLRSNDVATTTDSDIDQKKNRTDRSERATRLPDDFALTAERRLMAEAERLPAERTFAKFCDYWRGVSGARGRKLDWDATWRNWCRNDKDRGTQTNSASQSRAIP